MTEQSVGSNKLILSAIFFLPLPDHLTLNVEKLCCRCRNKAFFFQLEMWIGLTVCIGPSGKMHLLPIRISLVPEPRPHSLIEPFQRLVFFLHIPTEGSVIAFGIIHIHLTVDLIVQLPANDPGMVHIMLSQFFRDLS